MSFISNLNNETNCDKNSFPLPVIPTNIPAGTNTAFIKMTHHNHHLGKDSQNLDRYKLQCLFLASICIVFNLHWDVDSVTVHSELFAVAFKAHTFCIGTGVSSKFLKIGSNFVFGKTIMSVAPVS